MKLRLACLCLAALPIFANAAEGDVIRVYNWNDYIAPQVLADFEKQTGIHVDYQTFSAAEELRTALDKGEQFDIVVPTNDDLPRMISAGQLLPLDKGQLPNNKHLDPQILTKLAAFDPQNRYAMPYLWGSIGLAINTPQAEAAFGGPLPKSWSVLFDPKQSAKLAKCGISVLDESTDITTLLMNYQGRVLAKSPPRRIVRAGKSLMAIRPNLRMVDSELYIGELNDGTLCVAVAYVGDALTAADAGQPVDFVIPEEGSIMFVDSMAIPANAKRPDLALKFLNYMMQPEVAAQVTSETFYPNANIDSLPLLDEKLRTMPGIELDNVTRRRLSLLPALPAKVTEAVEAQWQTFKEEPSAAEPN